MDNSLIFQYILIAAIVLAASYSLFRIIRKTFSPKKFRKSGKAGCDKDCCG